MMKLIAPILAALACASTNAEAQITWQLAAAPQGAAAWPTEDILRAEFDALWVNWSKDVGASPALSRFRIEIRELTGSREVFAARSTWQLGQGRIELSPSRPWRAGLRHEMGHLFLREWRARHCSPSEAQSTPAWLDEIESLIWSEDEVSLRERSAEVPSLSRARQQLAAAWPEAEKFVAAVQDPQWVAAVSRLLLGPPNLQSSLRDQLFDLNLGELAQEASARLTQNRPLDQVKEPTQQVAKCAPAAVRAARWRSALLQLDSPARDLLHASAGSTGDLEYAVMDLWSGQWLEDSGESSRVRRPVASILKPLLIVAEPEAWPVIKSQATAEWACPQLQAPRNWTWSEALAKSCNGYFLAQARPLPLSLLADLAWLAPDDRQREVSVPESMGLIPRARADLHSVLSVYRALALHHPEVRDELRETAKSGTLSGLAESAKFVERGWALKSGTTRDLVGAPDVGWIVGISDSAVFAVRRRGTRPQALARDLEKLYQQWQSQSLLPSSAAIEMQLLTLVDEARIEMNCAGPWSIRGKDRAKRFLATEVFRPARLQPGESAVCWQGAWTASMPDAKSASRRTREVRGMVIKFGLIALADEAKAPEQKATPKQRRARRGTSLGLVTSRESYVAESLAAELASGPREAQLALAKVLAHNLLRGQHVSPRHDVQRLCDSTHCQVFGTHEPTRLHRQIAAQALREAPLPWAGWLEFSRGGVEAWSETVAPSAWALVWPEGLKLEELVFKRVGDRAVLRSADSTSLLTSKPAAKGGGTHGAQSDGQNVAQNVGQSVAETNCEKLRSRLRLRRCPDEVSWSQEERAFVVRGRGEGHDRGMNVEEALHLAREGRSADEILKLSYDRALK
jgi:hypothetical protein